MSSLTSEIRGGVARFAEAISPEPAIQPYNASAHDHGHLSRIEFRDGKKAVQLATRSCELTQWINPLILDTSPPPRPRPAILRGCKSQTKAIELLTDEREKADYRSRLVRYQAKKPYRQVPSELRPTDAGGQQLLPIIILLLEEE